jgi:protein-disulfide isomerase
MALFEKWQPVRLFYFRSVFVKRVLFLFLSIFVYSSIFAQPQTKNAFSPSQKEEIKKIVHEYLIESPEVLVEASKALQRKQFLQAKKESEEGVKKHFKQLVSGKGDPILGNPKGKIIVVEFMDYQCAHCKTMSEVVGELIKENKDLKVIVKELPVFGRNSELAAKAALAAYKQGQAKFLVFHKALFEADKKHLTEKSILSLAKSVQINEKQLQRDMNDPKIDRILTENIKLAQTLKLVATPAFVVANKEGTEISFILGAVPEPKKALQKLIDKAAGKK